MKPLHSAYNPEKEAARYVDSLTINEDVQYFILLECSAYIIPFLRKKKSNAKIISLHIRDEYLLSANTECAHETRADAEWSPSSRESRVEFLEKEIPDVEAAKIKIVEWRPALKIFGGEYLSVLKDIVLFTKRVHTNKKTIDAFSERWRRNIQKNAKIFKYATQQNFDTNKNIIICASGPSLEDEIPLIKSAKEKGSVVLAVSSSIAALVYHNIMPDMVITTDGGNWARFHLYEIIRAYGLMRRCNQNEKLPLIAASFHSALLSQFRDFPLLLFSDGSAEEDEAMRDLKIPLRSLPSRGTVSASAIDFALAISCVNGSSDCEIYLSGLDLKTFDIKSHARPYAFDALLYNSATRFNPYYNALYGRMTLFGDRAFSVYRDWFQNELKKYPRVCFLRDKVLKLDKGRS